MNAALQDTDNTADREIVITRLLNAPREVVFRAWTDKDQVGHWWGPNGFTITSSHREVRPGGVWRFVMHGPDGTDYDNKIEFLEVVEPERLAYTHADGDHPPEFHTTVTFVAEGSQTRLTLRATFVSADVCRKHKEEYGAVEGGQQTLARLAEHLASTVGTAIQTERELIFTRLLNAPRERVFQAWTDPALITQWFGPHGFSTTTKKMELKPGGKWEYVMHGPDGTDYANFSEYVAIEPPSRLVYRNHGGKPDAEEVHFELTATFVDQGGKTELTMRLLFPSPEARDVSAQYGAFEGGKQTLTRLAALLAKG